MFPFAVLWSQSCFGIILCMRSRVLSQLCRWSFRLSLVAVGWHGLVHDLIAAGAENAYVFVCSVDASAAYAIDGDFYLAMRNSVQPESTVWVNVSAKDPFRLVAPEGGMVELAPGGSCVYRVREESSSEDTFAGMIRIVKVDIAPDVLNVCSKAGSGILRLTNDSYLGDQVVWSSSPAGISGRGSSIVFSPHRLSPGTEYTVTARSELFPNCTDTCLVRIVQVELVTPCGDPVSEPSDSGDGQNEFTYSSDTPGVLTMNLKARVTPGDAARDVADSCVFRVESIGDSVKAWSAVNPAGRAVASGDSLVATVTFMGLPKSNSDFGKKAASIVFDGIPCDEKDYEVFFPKLAKNHPLGQPDSPNWFYYWKQGNVCSIPATAKYEPRPEIYGCWTRTNGLVLCDSAAQSDNTSRKVSARFCVTNWVYEIRHHSSLLAAVNDNSVGVSGEAYYVTNVVGGISEVEQEFKIGGDGEGIGCVAMTVKHELGHLDMNEIWVGSEEIVDAQRRSEEVAIETYGYDSLEAAVARQLKLERLFEYGDRDNRLGDGVPDGRERKGGDGVFSSDSDSDTFKLGELISDDYIGNGDNEVRMRKSEIEDFSDMYREDLDWANPGCQHKNKFGPKLNGGLK